MEMRPGNLSERFGKVVMSYRAAIKVCVGGIKSAPNFQSAAMLLRDMEVRSATFAIATSFIFGVGTIGSPAFAGTSGLNSQSAHSLDYCLESTTATYFYKPAGPSGQLDNWIFPRPS